MNGVYRVYQEGKLIAEHHNTLTTEGKKLILRYLAGQAGSIGEAISVGVMDTTATVSDIRLSFEVDRATVLLKNADYTNQYIIFKTTLPQSAVYNIYELSTWSSFSDSIAGEFNGRILTTFDTSIETWTNTTADTSGPRTSASSLRVDAAISSTTSTRSDIALDLSGYSVNDEFTLAFIKPNANVTTLVMVFENLSGGKFSLSKSITGLSTGYNVLSFRKGDFSVTGTIDWSGILRYGVDVTAGGTAGYVVLDGIRVEDNDTNNPAYVMVSRATLGTPIAKTAIAPMDIEYALDLNIT